MYLSPLGVLREASNRSVLRRNGSSEGSRSDALYGAASDVEIGLLPDYPERRRPFVAGGASTVDAREKDELSIKMHYIDFWLPGFESS
jgi:hypothetical protein